MKQKRDRSSPHSISRRDLLKVAAVGAAGLLTGCGPAAEPTPASTPTHTPAPTLSPTSAVEIRRPAIIQFYPDGPSTVVHTHHAGVWAGENLQPNVLRQMLDASITELTGLNDAAAAWSALFGPDERIAIKVNAFRNSVIWTHVPLVMTVVESLQAAGVPAEQIVIFDCSTDELLTAGYEINRDGPGVRCHGTDADYTAGWRVADISTELSNVLLSCDAVINMPVLKSHMISGVTFAMKNHYGTVKRPESLHGNIGRAMAGLNALPPIKDRTRLIIGDVLAACLRYKNTYPYWNSDYKGDSILMSYDPVGHDTLGLQILSRLRTEAGISSAAIAGMAKPCLRNGVELGLGTNDPAHIDLVELDLT